MANSKIFSLRKTLDLGMRRHSLEKHIKLKKNYIYIEREKEREREKMYIINIIKHTTTYEINKTILFMQ